MHQTLIYWLLILICSAAFDDFIALATPDPLDDVLASQNDEYTLRLDEAVQFWLAACKRGQFEVVSGDALIEALTPHHVQVWPLHAKAYTFITPSDVHHQRNPWLLR